MTIQRPPHVSPGEFSLAVLLQDLRDARADLARARRTPGNAPGSGNAARARVIAALEAYAAALEVRRLPVPYALRDELRIRKSACR